MFTHQAADALRELLDHDADIDKLRLMVAKGLTASNGGVVPNTIQGLPVFVIITTLC